jgi:catechol 2,3-dioxygenase-like lactoylglutathione lyase family enzyme
MITGIEHTAIASLDPHALAQWYVEHLNFTLQLDTGKTIYVKSPNHVILEFVFADSETAKPLIRDSGLRHIGFAVDDFDSTYLEMKAAGVRFEEQSINLPGMRLYFFRDPEGNYMHLVEREVPLI